VFTNTRLWLAVIAATASGFAAHAGSPNTLNTPKLEKFETEKTIGTETKHKADFDSDKQFHKPQKFEDVKTEKTEHKQKIEETEKTEHKHHKKGTSGNPTTSTPPVTYDLSTQKKL
jgi:hypothetical protein